MDGSQYLVKDYSIGGFRQGQVGRVIGVIIPTWNGIHLIKPCMDALYPQMKSGDEIIIVDNGSTDGTAEWIELHYPDVRLIKFRENKGFSAAVNAGIKISRCELVALLNNDTEVASDWLESLRKAAQEYPDCSMFSSRVLRKDPPGLIDTVGDGFTIAGFGYKIGWMQPDGPQFDRPQKVFGASACAALYRKSLFEKIGYFDEDFFAFAEDLDFSFRACWMGFFAVTCPTARVIHKVRATAPSDYAIRLYHRNLIWLIYKNYPSSLLLLYMPHFVLHLILTFTHGIFRGHWKSVVGGVLEGVRQINRMKNKRQWVQKNRTASLADIRRLLTGNWISVHWRLSSFRRKVYG